MRNYTIQPALCLLFACSAIFLSGQEPDSENLVINPGFEYYYNCPEESGSIAMSLEDIVAPTQGSTDYYNTCSHEMMAGGNFMGYQRPLEGDGYVGLYMFAPKDYREYVTLKLQETLIPGQRYEIRFFVSMAEKTEFAVSEFGILFTDKPMDVQTRRNIPVNVLQKRGLNTYTTAGNPHYFTDKDGWTQVVGAYIARGDENFITIGNFQSNADTKLTKKGSNLKKAAYYYMDHVSVKKSGDILLLDELYVLGDLKFDVDGYSIKNKKHPQLDHLIQLMRRDKNLVVSVFGHTDATGSDKYNRALSNRRAQAVAAYLQSKGISEKRINWTGYGELRPMADNSSENARLQNRRVEFVVSKEYLEHANLKFDDE